MTCIIVEDEPLAQFRLRDYIQKSPALQLEACFESATTALQFLMEQPVDLVFLDIHLDGLSGIELLEKNKLAAQVIFTTAYHEYAIKGFELNVTDYLLKPFSFERFQQAVEKAGQKQLQFFGAKDKNYLFIKSAYTIEKVLFEDILFIEGMRDYRKIHTTSKPIMTLQNFSDFEKELPPEILCRVHKSFMVAIAKIDAVDNNRITIGTRTIPVSATYKKNLLGIINNLR
jgi:two-component system, LytTR family, response regulator